MWNALNHRNFRILWIGQVVSVMGDQAFTVALNWLIASKFGSLGSMALMQLATSIPTALTRPISGSFIDKYSPRRILITLNLVMAVLMGVFTMLTLGNWMGFGLFLLFAALFGVFGSTLEPAFFTIIPRATDQQDLESANALVMLLYSVAGLIGPLVSAFLIAHFGNSVSFGFNGISFLLSGLFAMLVLLPQREQTGASKQLPKINEAWDWIMQHPWAIRLFATEALGNLALGFFWVSLPILLHNAVRVGVIGFGSIYSLIFLGATLASIVSGTFLKRVRDKGLIAYLAMVVLMGVMVLLVNQDQYVPILILSVVMGFSLPWFDMITHQALQEKAPEELLGRLTAIGGFLTTLPRLVAYLLLLVWQAPFVMLLVSGSVMLLFVVRALFKRRANESTLSVSL